MSEAKEYVMGDVVVVKEDFYFYDKYHKQGEVFTIELQHERHNFHNYVQLFDEWRDENVSTY